MHSRHLNRLMETLEAIEDVGYGEIRKSSLRAWYSRERITKPVWRDILTKWEEVSDEPLFIGDLEGSFSFIYGRGLTASKDAFFKPITEWAELGD